MTLSNILIRAAERVLSSSKIKIYPSVKVIARRKSIHAGINIQKDEIIKKK